jgi:Tol biopolymer transport system component
MENSSSIEKNRAVQRCLVQWLVFCLVFVTLAYPQVRDASVQEKVIANYPITSGDSPRPIQVSPLGGVLLQETKGSNTAFTISDASNSSIASEVLSVAESSEKQIWFSPDGRKINYALRQIGGKATLGVYDVRTGQRIFLRDSKKDMVSASVSTRDGRIVFQAREDRSLPKVYLAQPDGSGAEFITEGIGETWSPNGEWIAIKRPVNLNDFQPHPKTGKEIVPFSVGNLSAMLL